MADGSDFSPMRHLLFPQRSQPTPSAAAILAELFKTETTPPPLPLFVPVAPSQPNVAISRRRITVSLSQAIDGDITDGRILPSLDAIPIANGRKLKAAILYNDLKGFSGLVAGLPKKKTLSILHAFVSEMTRIASEFGGEVVDCAGDRIMAVFWRPHYNNDRQPIYDAICCGFWMQTVMDRAFRFVLAQKRLPSVSCGIGIDYGEVIATRVGIRSRNKLVLLGNAANNAAKLEDRAAEKQVVVSPIVYENRPTLIGAELFQPYPSWDAPTCYLSDAVFNDDTTRRQYVRR